jgi:hypothetical protein
MHVSRDVTALGREVAMHIVRFLGLLVWASMLAAGCGSENPFSRGAATADGSAEPPPAGAIVSFSADVVPLLAPCASCHNSGVGGWTYRGGGTAYAAVTDVVDRAAPDESLLLIKATGGNGHGGGQVFGANSTQYDTILRWVQQGAIDN